jgi:hypothetical protein
MKTPRRPPPALGREDARKVADIAGDAIREALPPADDGGLGPVGEQALTKLIDEADRDEEDHKRLMKFPPHWRAFIRKQDQNRLDAADEMIDDYLERKALRKFWTRIWRLSILVVPIVWGYASGFYEKVWPVIQKVLKLLQAPT